MNPMTSTSGKAPAKAPTRATPETLTAIIDKACADASASARDAAFLVRKPNGKADSVMILQKGSSRMVVVIDLYNKKAYVPLDGGDRTEDFGVCPSGKLHRFHGEASDSMITADGVSLKYIFQDGTFLNFVRMPVPVLLSADDAKASEMMISDDVIQPDLAEWMDRSGLAELSLCLDNGNLAFRRNNGDVLLGTDPSVPASIRDFFRDISADVQEANAFAALLAQVKDLLRAA